MSTEDDYDFAIYQRESNKLLIFQAKYLISSGNIYHKLLDKTQLIF